MPLYLGSDRVKGMYLGSDVYDGLALGSSSSTYDYGVDNYAMPMGTTDEASWTINTGFSSKSSDGTGMYFVEGASGGNCESPSITPVVGRKYQYVVSRPTGGTDASAGSYFVLFAVGGTVDVATQLTLDQGDTETYTYTALSTSPLSVVVFAFTSQVSDRLYLDEVYIKEVK